MRKIVMEVKTKVLSREAMWDKIIHIERYPEWVKYCKKIDITEVKEGATFSDITTLLWIPMKIHHKIISIKKYKEIIFFLPLPGGGKMWHTFTFGQDHDETYMRAEIKFDLGNILFNNTVGYILEKRWENILNNAFPEIRNAKRIQ